MTRDDAGPGFVDGHVDLLDYLRFVVKQRLAVVGTAVLFGFGAFVYSVWTDQVYEAVAKLMVTQSKFSDRAVQPLSTASFQALLDNQQLSSLVIQEFELDRPEWGLTPTRLLNYHVDSRILRDTNVIEIRVRLGKPDLAANVANRLSQLAVELADRLSLDEAVAAQTLIESQVDSSLARLEDIEQRLNAYRSKATIELLRKDVEVMLGQRSEMKPLLVEIEAERARLAQSEDQLAEKRRVDILRRSIDTSPALLEAVRSGNVEPSSILPLQLQDEFINPVYESLEHQIAESRTRLSGLEKRRSELIETLELNEGQAALLNELYGHEAVLSRLEAEYDLARVTYAEVATQYERVRLQVAGASTQLQVLDAALPPERPIAPRMGRNVTLAVGFGAVLSLVFLFLYFLIVVSAAAERPSRS